MLLPYSWVQIYNPTRPPIVPSPTDDKRYNQIRNLYLALEWFSPDKVKLTLRVSYRIWGWAPNHYDNNFGGPSRPSDGAPVGALFQYQDKLTAFWENVPEFVITMIQNSNSIFYTPDFQRSFLLDLRRVDKEFNSSVAKLQAGTFWSKNI